MAETRKIDAVTTEIIRNGMVAATEEMKSNLMRTAYNMIIYEALDFTVGIFDRAGNTREVKLVFSTLAESFKRPETKKRVVKESYASKATQTTAPKSAPILNEGFELADRWKKLAGLL